MLFAALYTPRGQSEESDKRGLQLFTNWTPPFEFKHHWTRSDGRGGITIFEADDPAVILEGISPFTAYFEFEVTPVLGIEGAVPVFAKVNEWRDSVS